MSTHRLLRFAIGIFLILASVEIPSSSVLGAPTGELKIGVNTLYTETFHPYRALPARKFYLDTMYDYLVGLDDKMNLDPNSGVAFKWEEAPDHLSWTYYIRDGVKFHDGTPLTLEDVKFSLETILDEKNVIGPPNFKPYLNRVEVVPPNKVVVHLKMPWIFMPYMVSPVSEGQCVILPKKYIEEKGVPYFENHPIGTGPYKFQEKREGDYIKLVAQDSHWRVGTPKYKYLTFKLMPEEGTRDAALRAGEVDVIQTSIARAAKLDADGFPIREKTGHADINLIFLRTYEQNNPISKKEVRQALVYAIDKAAIVKHVLLNRGRPIGHASYMFTTSLSYKEYPVTPYDPTKAKQLLAQAGYPNGFTMYLYSFDTGLSEQKLINETIAGYWKAVGMDVKILEMDYAAYRPVWLKQKDPAGPAAHTFVWPCKVAGSWAPLFGADTKTFQFSQVQDAELEKFIKEADNAVTVKANIEAERKSEEQILANFYTSGIAGIGLLFATKKDVPVWDLGKAAYSFNFEYVGAKK